MMRFSLLLVGCVFVAGIALLFVASSLGLLPHRQSAQQTGNPNEGPVIIDNGGKNDSSAGVPERLSRALEDRNRQYRDAKLKLLESATQLTSSFRTLASDIKSYKWSQRSHLAGLAKHHVQMQQVPSRRSSRSLSRTLSPACQPKGKAYGGVEARTRAHAKAPLFGWNARSS